MHKNEPDDPSNSSCVARIIVDSLICVKYCSRRARCGPLHTSLFALPDSVCGKTKNKHTHSIDKRNLNQTDTMSATTTTNYADVLPPAALQVLPNILVRIASVHYFCDDRVMCVRSCRDLLVSLLAGAQMAAHQSCTSSRTHVMPMCSSDFMHSALIKHHACSCVHSHRPRLARRPWCASTASRRRRTSSVSSSPSASSSTPVARCDYRYPHHYSRLSCYCCESSLSDTQSHLRAGERPHWQAHGRGRRARRTHQARRHAH